MIIEVAKQEAPRVNPDIDLDSLRKRFHTQSSRRKFIKSYAAAISDYLCSNLGGELTCGYWGSESQPWSPRPQPKEIEMPLYLVLMRGLPGSGKSTLARTIAEQKKAQVFATDDFWIEDDGGYRFEPSRLDEAHAWNMERTQKALSEGKSVVVDNCNTKNVYMEPYLELAERYKAKTTKVVAPLNDKDVGFLFYNNRHNVPFHIIEKMREEWEE